MNKENIKPDSIQHMFCEMYVKLPTREWDRLETSIIMNLVKNESKFDADPDPIMYMDLLIHKILVCPKGKEMKYENDLNGLKELYKFHYNIITKRVQLYDFNMNRTMKMIVAVTAHDLGEITQILTMIQYKCWLINDWEVKYETFLKMFPFGVATDEASDELWRLNKLRDKIGNEYNLLDCMSAMNSIRKENK